MLHRAARLMGICLGGHLAFRAAMNRDVLAAACFYAIDLPIPTPLPIIARRVLAAAAA
jgi:dienelactone hydrolase